MSTRLLLIGAHGFLGGHFRSEALAAGHDVVAAARKPSSSSELPCDLLDLRSVEAAVRQSNPAVITVLAGAASAGESWLDPSRTVEANTLGALHVLQAATRCDSKARLFFVSSADVYGAVSAESIPIREGHPLRPVSPYGSSKVAMEVLCSQYERSFGLPTTIVRSFNHLGPGQSRRFAASSFARQIALAERSGLNRVVLRVGDLTPIRDFTDVRDGVRAYRLLIEGEHDGTFNVCSGQPTRVREVLDMLAQETDVDVELDTQQTRLRRAEPPIIVGSADRLMHTTGWTPAIPLDRTLSDLLDFWRRRLASP